MTPQLCVLLYSKYSPKSRELLNMLERAPVDLSQVVGLQPVCIDNSHIRNKIQNATSVEVSTVPTVLIVHNTGSVEKYEAEQAFLWSEQTVNKFLPPEPPEPPEPPAPAQKPTQKHQETTSIEKLPDMSQEDPETPETPEASAMVEEPGGMPQPPPVGVRSGAGTYDIETNFGDAQEVPRGESAPTTAQQSKPRDLMAMAQAMQKEREQTASKPNNPR